MDNLAFDGIGDHWAQWLERKFEEEEVRQAVFDLARDKAPSLDRFPLALFLMFLGDDEKVFTCIHG